MIPNGVIIRTVDHASQRYSSVGDYWLDDNNMLHIAVSRTEDPRYAWLVALHEFTEAIACMIAGVDFKDVDDFDLMFEAEFAVGLHSEDEEPGDDSRSPYRRQHQLATLVERTAALFLGVSWSEYEDQLDELWNTTRERGMGASAATGS